MGIFIKNPEVERKARELARRRGQSLTQAVGEAVEAALAAENAKPRRKPTFEEMKAATDAFRRAVGLDKVVAKPMTKKDWDALWPTGLAEIDEA
ncbi:MAG: type II toxin-antitoxin system VapB family antitoxin [Caulobacteraceae bacterium]|nr:type II toxin-antitoxin system VapB family antitoxin [Caulobacteraceae bacterium]